MSEIETGYGQAQNRRRPPEPIPLNIITGFLGSGKTSLLNEILKSPDMADTAVIINEFGEVGLDHLLVDKVDDGIIELSSGCLCCTIRGDLVATLENLLRKLDNGRLEKLKRVVIETTGLADPAPVLHSVMLHPYLVMRYRLDGVVTLVDAVNGLNSLAEHEEAVRQVAVADRLVITKSDLVKGEEQEKTFIALKAELKRLNPGATTITRSIGEQEVADLINCGLYNPDSKVPEVKRWLNEEAYRDAHHHHAHEGEEHSHHHHHHGDDDGHAHDVNRHSKNIRAFTLVSERPISAGGLEMFMDLLRSAHGPKLLRVKGIILVGEHPDQPVVIHGVQHVFHPPARLAKWPDDERQSKLVFIVNGLAEGFVKRMFDAFTGGIASDTPDKTALMDNPLSIGGFSGFKN
ncbi:CobW family GTP-binding protein [Polycladidibacter stylochi]|uniref:CobW family GTP-binding protein n=1 Tax=Polycladidibacter stylochi TaxID=1807766 RepID=UPI00082F349B|nr:GTP-binding protein [Pseudovibrio stylochi]